MQNMETNSNSPADQPTNFRPEKSPPIGQHSPPMNYESLERFSCNTLKRNPKMELSKPDLLKLLSYFEGELQARDIVIATLKCEKVKQLLTGSRPIGVVTASDPHIALQRDNFAGSISSSNDEAQISSLADQQLSALENLIIQQKLSQIRITKVLKDMELRHQKEIEMVRTEKNLLEKEVRRLKENSEEEKNRQKQIVLLLLAERKKLVTKYIEERKRSEDLAQILTEEKGRIDSMAEGLEEESKKSLQMEAELEKQIAQFDTETQQLKASLAKYEKRCKELETELERSRKETAVLNLKLCEARQQTPSYPTIRPNVPGSISPPPPAAHATMKSSVAKVVQPTATVSSVPVSAPTTGIARSVSSSHGLQTTGVIQPAAPSPEPPSAGRLRVLAPDGKVMTVQGSKTSPVPSPDPVATVGRLNMVKMPDGKVMSVQGKINAIGRGTPPPVPPNKPVVPPKKDALFGRKFEESDSKSPSTLKTVPVMLKDKVLPEKSEAQNLSNGTVA
ncbi:uncharacterized protein Naus isoform X1 [Bemisia tabaci]|uniref:uncharacterized protein Naus isoform X1 n=2 Tax=Bemisia tabaci TaxID=7038 RepID=UPI0008F9A7B5|nr:PREDICTED: uncharacterized protein CG10915 isoform X1 [Bemisia tabaci]